MGNFLEKYNLPKLTQEETENLNRPITSNEIELVIKNYLRLPDGFTPEFHQTFTILLKVFQKEKRREYFPTHFMRPASH